MVEADGHTEMVLTPKFDLDELRRMCLTWGIFRDRCPELYGSLMGHEGKKKESWHAEIHFNP